jgi:hypothetical protein
MLRKLCRRRIDPHKLLNSFELSALPKASDTLLHYYRWITFEFRTLDFQNGFTEWTMKTPVPHTHLNPGEMRIHEILSTHVTLYLSISTLQIMISRTIPQAWITHSRMLIPTIFYSQPPVSTATTPFRPRITQHRWHRSITWCYAIPWSLIRNLSTSKGIRWFAHFTLSSLAGWLVSRFYGDKDGGTMFGFDLEGGKEIVNKVQV